MTLPVGILTAAVTVGKAYSFGGKLATAKATVIPSLGGDAQALVWAETGDIVAAFTETYESPSTGMPATFTLPQVDQEGFINGAGHAVTMFAFAVKVELTLVDSTVIRYTKYVQPLVGQDTIDLDLVPDGSITSPVSAPLPPVLSVNGQTGTVTIDPSSASDEEVADKLTTGELSKQALADEMSTDGTPANTVLNATIGTQVSTATDPIQAGLDAIPAAITTAVEPLAVRTRPRLGIFGDSITNQNILLVNGVPQMQGKGYFMWANALCRWRFDLILKNPPDDEWGDSGMTAYDLLHGGEAADAAASSADIFVVHCGTNDLTADAHNTLSEIVASITGIWDMLRDAGKVVVGTTILPRNYGSVGASDVLLRQVNRALIDEAKARRGMAFCDWFSAVLDPATGLADADLLYDGQVHPNQAGASRIGAVLAETLDRIAPPLDNLGRFDDEPGNLAHPTLALGTGGTKQTGATGDVATGWTLTGGGSPASLVGAKVPREGLVPGEWQQVTIAATDWTADSFTLDVRNASSTGDWTIGDTIIGAIEFETDATDWNVSALQLRVRCISATNGDVAVGQVPTADRTGAVKSIYRPPSGVLQTPPITIPTGTTRIQLDVLMYGSGTIRLARPLIQKLA